MAKRKPTQSLVQRLENPTNPAGRLDVLTYGLMNRIVNQQAERYGIPTVALTGIKDPLAKIANEVSKNVKKWGIQPDLVGIGLLAAMELYRNFQNGQTLQVPQNDGNPNMGGMGDSFHNRDGIRGNGNTGSHSNPKVKPQYEDWAGRGNVRNGRMGRF